MDCFERKIFKWFIDFIVMIKCNVYNELVGIVIKKYFKILYNFIDICEVFSIYLVLFIEDFEN